MKQLLLPSKIIKAKGVTNAQNLKIKKLLQPSLRNDVEWRNQMVNVVGPATLILDFGKEMHGGVRIITSRGCTKSVIHFRFGESLTEAMTPVGEKGATNDHIARDFDALIMGLSDATYGRTGFRFVQIDFPEGCNCIIQNIYCVNEILSKKPRYIYKGDDKRISDIYKTAKRTVDLCASSGLIWDGVKRDRLVWIGDMHPEMIALSTLYGRLKEIEYSLDTVRENTPLPGWMNNYASYSMWWITIIADYYKYTGCKDYVKKQLDYMQRLVEQVDGVTDEDGNTHYPWNFVDWPCKNSPEEYDGTRAITIIAINKAIELFDEFGIDTKIAQKVLAKLKKLPINCGSKKQIIALKYLAEGKISDEEYDKLVAGGAKGLSTFMSYYILTAIASRDEKLAIEIMKEYYGGMLDVGATTFWEDFDVEWVENCNKLNKRPRGGQKDIHSDFGNYCYKGLRHSFCHGWSSGVIRFIEEHC